MMSTTEQLKFEKNDIKEITELSVDVRYIKEKIDDFEKIIKELTKNQQNHEEQLRAIKSSLDSFASKQRRLPDFITNNWHKILIIIKPALYIAGGALIDHFFRIFK